MKKIFKNPIFIFILGGLVFGSIGVYATLSLTAEDVTYGAGTVKSALDILYTKAKPAYTGSTTVTPTTTEQTLNTANTILNSNITVGAIPSTYKNLSTTTTVAANYLLNGKTAYDNSGNLITGTLTECISGTYNKPANSNWNISLGFVPSRYYLFFNVTTAGTAYTIFYDSVHTKTYIINHANSTVQNFSASSKISNNSLVSELSTSGDTYKANVTMYYMACK